MVDCLLNLSGFRRQKGTAEIELQAPVAKQNIITVIHVIHVNMN